MLKLVQMQNWYVITLFRQSREYFYGIWQYKDLSIVSFLLGENNSQNFDKTLIKHKKLEENSSLLYQIYTSIVI